MESVAPLIVWKREIRQDSGGAGTFRGGYGQELIVEVSSPNPVTLSILAERTNYSFPGLFGGHDGASLGINKLNGEGPSLPSKGIAQLMPGDIVQLLHGGGGGYGPPEKRDLRMVQADLRNEIISPEEAESKYLLSKRQRDLKVK
jgi:N-methylhydantoinase B